MTFLTVVPFMMRTFATFSRWKPTEELSKRLEHPREVVFVAARVMSILR
jgi:hypothetical protein